MRILFDNIIFELQRAGGISKVWYNLIKIIQTHVDIKFLESENTNNIFRNELELSEGHLIRDNNLALLIRRFKKVSCSKEFDIFHSSYLRPLKVKGSTKVVVTIHDFIYEKYSNGIPKLMHVFLKKRALKQADAVICVSEHTKKDFLKYYPRLPEERVFVVHNGVDSLFRPIPKKEEIILENRSYEKEKFLLYVGNRGHCKNFPFVLELMNTSFVKELSLQLLCVGAPPSPLEIEDMKKRDIVDKVSFVSGVSSEQLNVLYNHAFCLLFPSIYEGFGIPAVEAMKSGCPIWSTKSSSVKELLGEHYPVSFNPNKWHEAEQAFGELCLPSVRKKAIDEGMRQSKKFSWEKCAEETVKVYKELMKNG
jgi:mannosyltransferase